MPKGNWREFNDSSSTPKSSCHKSKTPINLQSIRIQKIKGGKNGKTVTVITGLELNNVELRNVLKQLKKYGGTGGTIKQNSLELQGDQVAMALDFLSKQGYRPKQAGG